MKAAESMLSLSNIYERTINSRRCKL